MVAAIIFVALLVACVSDIFWRIIPNSVCALVAITGVCWQLTQSPSHLTNGLIQAAVLFAIILPVWGRGLIGGGDAKLLVALSLGLSFAEFMRTLFGMVVIGGVIGCVYLLLSRLPLTETSYAGPSRLRQAFAAERGRILARESIPYGVAIALGWAFAVLPSRLEGSAWPFGS